MEKPIFLITIDTEGDNLWESPSIIQVKNAGFIPRFQYLCQKYGFRPTYLTNYEMAISPEFQKFAFDVIDEKTAEIGMHLHAWNSPPQVALTNNDFLYHPYLIEYPEDVMFNKILYITELLEKTFGVKIRSHRAGRWAFNEQYCKILGEFNYLVDCSVTPGVSWKSTLGNPTGTGGTDYRFFPKEAYFLNNKDISKMGDCAILEIPMTIIQNNIQYSNYINEITGKIPILDKTVNYFFPRTLWLRPNGKNLSNMMKILDKAHLERWDYVMFMLHSSELMAGGSPTFKTQKSIEKLYSDLNTLFSYAQNKFIGMTLTEYYTSSLNRVGEIYRADGPV